ncbi:MAG: YdcF family protein, partial [Gammaproteobacteria bacterium]|nr:YdcF family protein [Gammaproteobacteria bacterium]
MLITLKTLLHTLLLPPGGPLLIAAAGAWLLGRARTLRARRCGWMLLCAGLGSLWLLAMPAVANILSDAARRYPPLNLSLPTRAQAIVILGGGESRPVAPEYGGA